MLRKLLLYLFVVGVFLLSASPLYARERVQGWCEQGGNTLTVVGLETTDKAQQSFPGCTVTVWDAGTTDIASIFSDDVGTAKANPFTADGTTGLWSFYADNARYDVQLSGGGLAAPFTLSDFLLADTAQAVTTISAVTFSTTPVFDVGKASILTITLTGNVTSSTVTNGVIGQVITIHIAQDAIGGRAFVWPADVVLRTGTLVVADDASAVTTATFYYTGTQWREIGVDSDEIGRVLIPVTTGGDFGSLTRRWNMFIAAMDISGVFTGDLVPAATGQDVGSASARPDGIFDVMTVGLWNGIPVVEGNRFTTIQAGVDQLPATGGTTFIPGGTHALGGTGIVVASSKPGVRLVGAGNLATIITYTGTGSAVTFGDSSAPTEYYAVSDLTIDISGAASTAKCLTANRTFRLLLVNFTCTTTTGGAVATGQTAITLDGTSGNFSPYAVWINSTITGDFTKGVEMTNAVTATVFIGGAIVQTSTGTPTGTIGVEMNTAGTGRAWGTDVAGWHEGVHIFSGSNSGGPWAFRFEGNTTDWVVDSGALANSFMGATFFTFTDNGTNTQYSSNTNGGLIQTLIQKLEAHSRLPGEVALLISGNPGESAIGFTQDQAGAVDAKIRRISASTFVVDSNWGVRRSSTGSAAFTSRLDTGDTVDRFLTTIGGRMDWSSGVAAADVSLQRTAANELGLSAGDTFNSDRYRAARGTVLVVGDFALSAGFGTTATVTSVTGTDQRHGFTVNSSGTGQGANPTITLTFGDGAWTAAPHMVCGKTGGDQLAVVLTWTTTTTTTIITFRGTPVAAETYGIECILMG